MNYKGIYDKLYSVGYHDKGKNLGQQYVPFLCQRFKFKSVLDVGCANGLSVKSFQNYRKFSYGIDISEIAIRYATEQYHVRNCIEGNVLNIPFRDRFVDAVFTCDVLEHLAPHDIRKAIKEIIRVSRKYLFIKVSDTIEHNREFLDKASQKWEEVFMNIPNLHMTVLSFREWKEIFQGEFKLKLLHTEEGLWIYESPNKE